jgi:hypothetical protein
MITTQSVTSKDLNTCHSQVKTGIKMETELQISYDARKSFYGKAKIISENGEMALISYNTKVAYIKDGKAVFLGIWGCTTTRHIKEFLKQNSFDVGKGSGKDMFRLYGIKIEERN